MSKYETPGETLPPGAGRSSHSHWGSTQTYVTVGVVAAAVSATVAYVVWSRYHARHQESVQELLDDAHSKVRSIEQRLGDMRAATGQTPVPVPSARYLASLSNVDRGA